METLIWTDPGLGQCYIRLDSDLGIRCLEDSTRVHCPGELNWRRKRHSYPRVRGNGAASVKLASSSRPLPVTQHTGTDWLNAETIESCEGVRCRPGRRSADVCQRGAVHFFVLS